jgi:uncharacterized protein YdhG (YjbR/CyaY superfamily)
MIASNEVDKYIANFPRDVQDKLIQIRQAILSEVPTAGEKISYGVPAATFGGKAFIYFAGYKNHVSIYPVTPAIEKYVKDLTKYRTGKGTLQFKLDEPLPMTFIRKVIKVRAKEHLEKLK